jgi:hypothetical protein
MLDRFTDLLDLPESLDWISSWWAIGTGMVLLVVDVTLDKVPGVDHLSDMLQTAVRPLMGGVMFAAAAGAQQLEASDWWRENPWIGAVIGVALAGSVHATKALSRPIVNAGTLGLGGPAVSAADVTSATVTVVAILVPVLVVLVLLVIGLVAWRVLRFRRRLLRRRRARDDGASPRVGPPGQELEG